VCVVLVTQHAKLVHRITLLSVACPTLIYISTISHKGHDFLKNLQKIKFVSRFSLHFSFWKEFSDILS